MSDDIDALTSFWVALLLCIVYLFIKCGAEFARRGLEKAPFAQTLDCRSVQGKREAGYGVKSAPKKDDEACLRDLSAYKKLYYELHNIEQFPDILPTCRDQLIGLFNEALSSAFEESNSGIFSIQKYSLGHLKQLLQAEDEEISRQWTEYMERRKAGLPPEMFGDMDEAKWWLKQIAPVKFVDGAWLGHIHKITTPFALRRATKDAWQVMSEELGDGYSHMNHVQVYRELMKDIFSGLPDADSSDFISAHHQLNEICVWKAAVAQLLISLFPHEFLPEVLGFNLHFESIKLETLVAAKELEGFGLNPYYFILHISIDNADSGHTAIALQAVSKYLDHIEKTLGADELQTAWRRVQVGFTLSRELPGSPKCPSKRIVSSEMGLEANLIKVFQAKAAVASKIHCGSRIRLGGRPLMQWLEPQSLQEQQWQKDFLYYLSRAKPWVRRGKSDKSCLVQEMSWGGKMFGSFTRSEVELVRQWIDGLKESNPYQYWSFVGRPATKSRMVLEGTDIRINYPVFSPIPSSKDGEMQTTPPACLQPIFSRLELEATGDINLDKLLPLWFSSPCLLECFACIPCKTTSKLYSSAIRLLRAQAGFETEGDCVSGMDEVLREGCSGLVDLGLELVESAGHSKPATLKEVLERWPSSFAVYMLHLSMRPTANAATLLGLTLAFAHMHERTASSALLPNSRRATLAHLAMRERHCLQACFDSMKGDTDQRTAFDRGYSVGRFQVESCFG